MKKTLTFFLTMFLLFGVTLNVFALSAPNKITPANMTSVQISDDGKVFFDWSDVSDADHYNFILGGYKTTIGIGSSYQMTLSEGSYTWNVEACDTFETSCLKGSDYIFEAVAPAPSGGDDDGGDDDTGGADPGSSSSSSSTGIDNPITTDTFSELIDMIVNIFFYLALALTPLMIVIAGFNFLTAGGNPSKIETAKKIILYTVIGFAIILLSKAIIGFVQGILGV